MADLHRSRLAAALVGGLDREWMIDLL